MDGAGADDHKQARVAAIEYRFQRAAPGQDSLRSGLRHGHASMNFLRRGHRVEGFNIQIFSLLHGKSPHGFWQKVAILRGYPKDSARFAMPGISADIR
jgi:hypothetical protein